jgi:hypothetical protein
MAFIVLRRPPLPAVRLGIAHTAGGEKAAIGSCHLFLSHLFLSPVSTIPQLIEKQSTAATMEAPKPIHPTCRSQKEDGGENSWPLDSRLAANEQAMFHTNPPVTINSGNEAGLLIGKFTLTTSQRLRGRIGGTNCCYRFLPPFPSPVCASSSSRIRSADYTDFADKGKWISDSPQSFKHLRNL